MTAAELSHIILSALVLIGASVLTVFGKVDSTVTISIYILVIGGSAATQIGANNVLKGLQAGLPLTPPTPTPAASEQVLHAPQLQGAPA